MFTSSIFHYFFFTSKFAILYFLKSITPIFNLSNRTRKVLSTLAFKNLTRDILDKRILLYTTISSYLFSATLIIPYIEEGLSMDVYVDSSHYSIEGEDVLFEDEYSKVIIKNEIENE
jgi:hypothetical protein